MSRTLKGHKGAGYEYWSRRPGKLNFGGGIPGKITKKVTHRAERRESKKETKE